MIHFVVNKTPPPRVLICQTIRPGKLLPLLDFNNWQEFKEFLDAGSKVYKNNEITIPEVILKAFREEAGD